MSESATKNHTVVIDDSPSSPIRLLAQRIAAELEQMTPEAKAHCTQTDSLLYVGQWHDAIPRAIWLDPLLDAIDVRCWGLIRCQAQAGSAVLLSLHRWLQRQLGYSKPTVSKVLFILRLTRWISLCSELRNTQGQFKGHIYAIHDAPIALRDAIYLDSGYLTFVRRQCRHQHRQVRRIASELWQSLEQTIVRQHTFCDDSVPSSALTDFFHQVNGQDRVNQINPADQVNFINLADSPRVNLLNPVKCSEEIKENQRDKMEVNEIDRAGPYTTTTTTSSCSSLKNKTTTTAKTEFKNQIDHELASNLHFPAEFNASEQELAKLYLQRIEPDQQQGFLDETAAQIVAKRKTSKPIRNPVAYLGWLCSEYSKGNTLLTSLSVRYRENRERQQRTEQRLRQKQQEMAGLERTEHENATHARRRELSKRRDPNTFKQLKEALHGRRHAKLQ